MHVLLSLLLLLCAPSLMHAMIVDFASEPLATGSLSWMLIGMHAPKDNEQSYIALNS